MDRVPVEAQTIDEVGYNASCRTLEVLLRSGAIYLYYFVPLDVHDGLIKAADHDAYFVRNIRGVYEHHRISESWPDWSDGPKQKRKR